MIENILIIGSKSSLAKHILEKLKDSSFKISSISRKDFNLVKNFKKLEKIIIRTRPKIIINCVAIKYKESDNSPKDAYEVNAFFPYKLAILCENIDVILIHFSTDSIFDGNKKYFCSVNDVPLPSSMYGKSKLLGEYSLIGFRNSLIIRVALLFGKFFKKNFVYNILTELKKNKKIEVLSFEFVYGIEKKIHEKLKIFILKLLGYKIIHYKNLIKSINKNKFHKKIRFSDISPSFLNRFCAVFPSISAPNRAV